MHGNELRRIDSDTALSWREVLVLIAGMLAVACSCVAMPIVVLVWAHGRVVLRPVYIVLEMWGLIMDIHR